MCTGWLMSLEPPPPTRLQEPERWRRVHGALTGAGATAEGSGRHPPKSRKRSLPVQNGQNTKKVRVPKQYWPSKTQPSPRRSPTLTRESSPSWEPCERAEARLSMELMSVSSSTPPSPSRTTHLRPSSEPSTCTSAPPSSSPIQRK